MTFSWGLLAPCLLFMACVAVATYAQNLTGFAFGLILLGLVAVLQIASVADTANAATVLTLVNAWAYFRLHRASPPWQLMRPALGSSLAGVAVGVALLGWLSGNAVQVLRGLLGVCIVACALLLVLQGRPRATLSGRMAFAVAGGLSGLLGGLFSSSGPPLVYHMYRQPLPGELVRRSLLLMFAANAGLRLVLVVTAGQFSWRAALLGACSVPVVYGVTRLNHRYPSRLAPRVLQRIVAAMLMLAGATLIVSTWAARA